MKQLKSKLVAILTFVIVLSCIGAVMSRANAENPITVYGEAVTAAAGKEIKVPVMVKDNHGVAGLALKVTYDGAVMAPVKAEKGSLLSNLANLQYGDTIANHTEESFECVAYNDSDFSDHGELFVLTFQITDTAAAGSHVLKLELTEHYNEALADVEAGCEDITITVSNAGSTGTPSDSAKPGVSSKPSASVQPQATAQPNTTEKPNATTKPKKKTAHRITKKPGRVKITKIKNIAKGRAEVTWGKVKCNYKYKVQVSYNKKFSGVLWYEELSKSKKAYTFKTNVLKKYSSKKTLYVRVRAMNYGYSSKYADYKTWISGKWSKVKKIKRK